MKSRRPRVIVVDWASDDMDPLPFRQDTWSADLSKTLRVNASEFAMPRHSAPAAIEEIRAASSFELSRDANRPVALWYGGFEQAAARRSEITQWLLGDNSALP